MYWFFKYWCSFIIFMKKGYLFFPFKVIKGIRQEQDTSRPPKSHRYWMEVSFLNPLPSTSHFRDCTLLTVANPWKEPQVSQPPHFPPVTKMTNPWPPPHHASPSSIPRLQSLLLWPQAALMIAAGEQTETSTGQSTAIHRQVSLWLAQLHCTQMNQMCVLISARTPTKASLYLDSESC